MRFVIVRTVKAGTRVHCHARLVVSEVPQGIEYGAVMVALEAAGKATEFADAGIPWGNHEVRADGSLPPGTVGVDDAPTIRWAELTNDKISPRRITLRLRPVDYDLVHRAARRTNTSIQHWCVDTLRQAAIRDT